MKNSKKRVMGKNLLLAIIVILIVIAIVAAVSGGEWRPVWDKMWQWVNFLLLVTAIYWWGWPLFMKLLDGRINAVADDMNQLEKETADISAEIKDIEEQLTKSEERFDQIKAKLEQDIAAKREQIIENAKKEATSIIEQAKTQRMAILDQAKKGLKAELVDMAVNNALAKLPETITDKDQKQLFKNFCANAFKTPATAA